VLRSLVEISAGMAFCGGCEYRSKTGRVFTFLVEPSRTIHHLMTRP